MSAALGTMLLLLMQHISAGKSDADMRIQQSRIIELELPYNRVFDLCIESLGLIAKCKLQHKSRFKGKIVAKVGITWETWGELISIEVNEMNDKRVQVEISSKSTARRVKVDYYGKNLENVNKIVDFLNAYEERAR